MSEEIELDELIEIRERLRGLDKKDIVEIFRKTLWQKRKDKIVEALLDNVSFDEILKNASRKIRESLLNEPSKEKHMKRALGKWLKSLGWDAVKEEIPVVQESVADIVAIKKGRLRGRRICIVELKTSRASKSYLDRGFRQINDFLRGANLVYLAITPLLLWQKGLRFFTRRLEPLNAGLIVADGEQVLNYLVAEYSKYIDEDIWNRVWDFFK